MGRRALPSGRHRSYARLRGRGRGGAGRHRHADGKGIVVDATGDAGRQVPRCGGGVDGRVLLRGTGCRGRRGRRHRCGRRRARLGRARLRFRDQPARRRGTSPGCRMDGNGAGTLRRNPVPRGAAAAGQHARLPDPDDRRIATDRGEARRKPRSARAVRGEGGERGCAAQLSAGAHQRDLRRHRHPSDRAAGLPGSRARGDPGEKAQGAAAAKRRRAQPAPVGG